MIKEIFDKQVFELKKLWLNKRQLLFQVLNLAMIVFSALMIWKGLMVCTKVSGTSNSIALYNINVQ
jgi:signal peptidase